MKACGSEIEAKVEVCHGAAEQSVILLRWVLIIAIAYLVLFSRPLAELPVAAALFIAFYLGSNVLMASLVRHTTDSVRIEWLMVVLDVAAVTLALYLTNDGGELFVLYFVVLFLSALADGAGLAVAAAVVIGVAHLFTASTFVDLGELVQRGYMARLPFLFAVALFFGHVVQRARRREREAREASSRRQRMEFLSSVSHDLRNPLGVVESLSNLLLDGDAGRLNPDQDQLVQRIHASIRQALNLSNNLIDAERIELDHFPLRRRVTDLRVLIEESLVLARTAADLKGIALSCDVPVLASRADVDAVQIERALSNLLGNAIKFTPRGGRIRVALQAREDRWCLTVSDSGPGMPEELLREVGRKHITGSDVRGSGLGLFIATAVAEAHGGRLSVESTPGGGTTVTLALPRHPIEADVEAIAPGEPAPYLARAG